MASVYLLSYRAVLQTGDTRRAMDAVTSYVRYGDWLMDETSWSKPALTVRDEMHLPLIEYGVEERLNVLLAAPLLKIAEAVPRLGNIHSLWLFNILVTALSVGLIYLILRQLAFGDSVGVLVATTAGLGTNLWAYSQTFFREPLAMLFILFSFFAILVGRGGRWRRRLLSLLIAAASLGFAVLTKSSAILALPGLLALALPVTNSVSERTKRRVAAVVLGVSFVVLLLFMWVDPLPVGLQDFLARFGLGGSYVGAALRMYFLSPGASIWSTSPVLLLALAGGVILWREGRYQLVVAIWLIGFAYGFGHAISAGPHWFGGLSFPPRFLVPAVAVLILGTAPMADRLVRERRRAAGLLWLILLVYGLWIQFSAVSLDWWHYGESLPPEASGFAEWEAALAQPQYFRWVVLPRRWADLGLNFIWVRSQLPIWGLGFGIYGAIIGLSILLLLREPRRRWRHATWSLAVLLLPLTLLNLSLAYDRDPRTRSQQEALFEALDFLEANATADDVLLLPGNDYGDFILNHLDGPVPRPVILPRPRAQAASDKQPAEVVSGNSNDWFDVPSVRIINHLAGTHERLWILENTSPYMTWSFRPLERYFALHYYPLSEVPLRSADDTVRLLEVSTRGSAPNPLSAYSGDIATDLRYGEAIRLLAFELPGGTRYRAGDVVELSLLWRAEDALEQDYTVAWFVADPQTGQAVAQGMDTGPQNGFAPTSRWKPEAQIWDNRALRLPGSLAAGRYRIWVLLYHFDSGVGEIVRLPVRGAEVAEGGRVGVLPVTLTVE